MFGRKAKIKKSIVLLTQWFDPEPTFKGLLFAKQLHSLGYDVEVVTGFPNYPGGKLYPRYKLKVFEKNKIDNISITRLWLYPSHDNSSIKRIINYLSFSLTSFIYCLFFMKRCHVMYAYHPPLTVGMTGLLIQFFRRIPVVYDIQDMWPDTLKATGMITNKLLLNSIGFVANKIYANLTHIVVLSHGFKKCLIRRGLSANKITVIHNWCDENFLKSNSKNISKNLIPSDTFKIVFAGNLGKAQNLSAVIESAELLQAQKKDVTFFFIGSGIDKDNLKTLVKEKRLKNIVFMPRVPFNKIADFLIESDVLLVHLSNDDLFKITIPSKIQAYLYLAKPVLICLEGDGADIINNARCGISVKPGCKYKLSEAVNQFMNLSKKELQQMGMNAKKYYVDNFSFEKGVNRFNEIFNDII